MAKRKRGRKKSGRGIDRFASKEQWRWAFATKKSWARRWARRSAPYKSLPNQVR